MFEKDVTEYEERLLEHNWSVNKAHALLTGLFGSLEIFPFSNICYFSSRSNILKTMLTTILELLLTRYKKKKNKNTHVVEAQVIKASFKHESLTLWIKDKKKKSLKSFLSQKILVIIKWNARINRQ